MAELRPSLSLALAEARRRYRSPRYWLFCAQSRGEVQVCDAKDPKKPIATVYGSSDEERE